MGRQAFGVLAEAGEQFLLLVCKAKAHIKGVLTDTSIRRVPPTDFEKSRQGPPGPQPISASHSMLASLRILAMYIEVCSGTLILWVLRLGSSLFVKNPERNCFFVFDPDRTSLRETYPYPSSSNPESNLRYVL